MQTQIFKANLLTPAQITQLANALTKGALAVLPTDTVYGLGTGAGNETAVQKIYTIKKRAASQPLQLLVGDLETACQVAQFSAGVARLAKTYWPGGLTLIVPPTAAGKPLLRGATGVGLRVPAHPVLLQILKHMSGPLACTSANLHGQPVLTQEEDVIHTFNGQVDFIITEGSLSPVASTVLDATQTPARVLREGAVSKQALAQTLGQPVH